MPDVPVVVLPSGTNGLAWIRSLGRKKVHVIAADEDPHCVGRRSVHASEFFRYPPVMSDPGGFVDALLAQAARWKGAILIPTNDEVLEVLSRHREKFREHFRVPVCAWDRMQFMLHKDLSYPEARAIGLDVPLTLKVSAEGEIQGDLADMRYPCIVKPVAVHEFRRVFHTKVFEAKSADEVLHFVDIAGRHSMQVLVQEIIPGEATRIHGYNAYYDQASRPLAEITYQKLRQHPPLFGVGRIEVSTRNAEIVELSRRILTHLRYEGPVDVEYKLDPRDGKYKFFEINARSPLQIQLAIGCGVDIPWILYCDLTGRPLSDELLDAAHYRTGVYWIGLTAEVEVLLRYRDQERLGWRERMIPYRGPKVWDVWDRQDPKPMWAEARNFVRGGIRLLKRRFGSEEDPAK